MVKKRSGSKDKLTKQGKQFAEEIWEEYKANPNGDGDRESRFPVETDKLIATLYGSDDPFTPKNFSVPGVDSPTKKLQMFVDKDRPFTGTFQCIDPETGYAKKSKLGVNSRQCLGEWLTVALIEFSKIRKRAQDLTESEGPEAATDFLKGELSNLSRIYRMFWFLKDNKNLTSGEKKKIDVAMRKIQTWLTFSSDLQLAKKIQTQQEEYFQGAFQMLKSPDLSAREKATLSSTLLKIAGDNPKYAEAKQAIIDQQTVLSNEENAKINEALDDLYEVIDKFKGVSYEKQLILRDYFVEELNSSRKTINLLTSSKFTGKDKEVPAMASTLVAATKGLYTSAELKQMAKKLSEKYADVKPVSFATQPSRFNSAEERGILSHYNDYAKSKSDFDLLSGKNIQPVCEKIDEQKVQQFLANYVNYHELMSLYMIFYYTGCSPYYNDNKSVKALANDWLRWLQGNPFHVRFKYGRVDSVDDLRMEEFNRIAPQNFFPLLSDWMGTGDTSKANFGFNEDNAGATFKNFTDGFNSMVNTANEIVTTCASVKGKITPYSEGVKFLATFVQNFKAIYDAVNKETAIAWVKRENGEIVREVSSNAIAKCEGTLNMGTLAASLGKGVGASETGKEETKKPVIDKAKLLDKEVDIRLVVATSQANDTLNDRIDGKMQKNQAATNWEDRINFPDGNAPNRDFATTPTYVVVPNVDTNTPLFDTLVKFGFVTTGRPMFAKYTVEDSVSAAIPVDDRVPPTFIRDARDLEYFAGDPDDPDSGFPNSKYAQPLKVAFNSDNLRQKQLYIIVSDNK